MRGYFEIGVYQPKKEHNIGTLLRSAYQLGAAGVFIIGPRFKKQHSDTCNTPRHIPLREFASFESFLAARPYGAQLVGVETLDYGGRWLSQFSHPEQCMYLLGSEDSGLPLDVIRKCNSIVSIESLRQPSYNVAVAGSLIMYHRAISFFKSLPPPLP